MAALCCGADGLLRTARGRASVGGRCQRTWPRFVAAQKVCRGRGERRLCCRAQGLPGTARARGERRRTLPAHVAALCCGAEGLPGQGPASALLPRTRSAGDSARREGSFRATSACGMLENNGIQMPADLPLVQDSACEKKPGFKKEKRGCKKWVVSVLGGTKNYKQQFDIWMTNLLNEVEKMAETENSELALKVEFGVKPDIEVLVKHTLDVHNVDIKTGKDNKHGRLDDFLLEAKRYHMVQNEQTTSMSPNWWKFMGNERAKESGGGCRMVQHEKSPAFVDAGISFCCKDARPLQKLIVRGFVFGVTVSCEMVGVPGKHSVNKKQIVKIDFRQLVNDRYNKARSVIAGCNGGAAFKSKKNAGTSKLPGAEEDVSKSKAAFTNKKNDGTSNLSQKQKTVPVDDEIPPPPPPKNIASGARLLFDDDGGMTRSSVGEEGSYRQSFRGFSGEGQLLFDDDEVHTSGKEEQGEGGGFRERLGGFSTYGDGGMTWSSVGDSECGTMRANEGLGKHSEFLSRDSDDGTMPGGGATSFAAGDDSVMQDAAGNMQYDPRDIVADGFSDILDTFWYPCFEMHEDQHVQQMFDASVPPAQTLPVETLQAPPVLPQAPAVETLQAPAVETLQAPAVVAPMAVASEGEGRKRRRICLNMPPLQPFGGGVMGRM